MRVRGEREGRKQKHTILSRVHDIDVLYFYDLFAVKLSNVLRTSLFALGCFSSFTFMLRIGATVPVPHYSTNGDPVLQVSRTWSSLGTPNEGVPRSQEHISKRNF